MEIINTVIETFGLELEILPIFQTNEMRNTAVKNVILQFLMTYSLMTITPILPKSQLKLSRFLKI
jgi:hypothetical protein